MVNYWLCVTNEENWEVVRKRQVWGVPERRGRKVIEAVRPGDYLIFYVKSKRIGGIFEAVSEAFESSERIFSWGEFGREEIFPFRVKLRPVVVADEPIEIGELIGKLSFTKGLRRWSVRLRRAMLRVSARDFKLIRGLLESR